MTGAWVWAGARAIGTAHLGQGLPCQDAFACKIWQRADASPVLIAALADGAGSAERAEIGSALGPSEGTIKNHVSSILAKLGVRDRVRAVLRGLELGYI